MPEAMSVPGCTPDNYHLKSYCLQTGSNAVGAAVPAVFKNAVNPPIPDPRVYFVFFLFFRLAYLRSALDLSP